MRPPTVILTSFKSMRQLLIRQACQDLLGQPLGVICFHEKPLPNSILMSCLLPHLLQHLFLRALDEPKPENGDQHVKREHDEGPKGEVDLHMVTI